MAWVEAHRILLDRFLEEGGLMRVRIRLIPHGGLEVDGARAVEGEGEEHGVVWVYILVYSHPCKNYLGGSTEKWVIECQNGLLGRTVSMFSLSCDVEG